MRAGLGAIGRGPPWAAAGAANFDTERALTPQEVRGWRLFSREARCASCHLVGSDSAAFTDGGFHSIGIAYGKAGYADIGLFKTPSLRNVGRRPRLMHDGSMAPAGGQLL